MKRIESVRKIKEGNSSFDVAVIGGGATGLGIAVDAATRGFSVILLEKSDIAKGTSSRSTKLVHGGVRYLAQGNIRLVLEALKERGIMRRNASHLVHDMAFVVPVYRWWMVPFYYVGLKIYDLLSGKYSLGKSRYLSRKKVVQYLPSVRQKGLKGGIVYHDGQFDDSRMAVSLAKTAEEHGAVILNYMEVTRIKGRSPEGKYRLTCRDYFMEDSMEIEVKAVFNAAGVFADEVQQLDHPEARRLITASQGAHIVVDGDFMPGHHGMMIPRTPDGRVLFAVPWHQKVLIGTTDTPVDEADPDPVPTEKEIDFILETARGYLENPPGREDIRSVFAGLRPLAAPEEEGARTKEISRGHRIIVSEQKLITIIGGKWTTYRKMAEDAVDEAIRQELLPDRPCRTKDVFIWVSELDKNNLTKTIAQTPSGEVDTLSLSYMVTAEDVLYTIREEYALTIEDILSRRIRLLILDAQTAIRLAPKIANILEVELGTDRYDKDQDLKRFQKLAKKYLVKIPS